MGLEEEDAFFSVTPRLPPLLRFATDVLLSIVPLPAESCLDEVPPVVTVGASDREPLLRPIMKPMAPTISTKETGRTFAFMVV
jgi:hypothetical protein